MTHGRCRTLEPSVYKATHLELCNSYQNLTRCACVTPAYRISQRQENPVCPDRKPVGWTGGRQAGCLMALSVFAYQIWEWRLCGWRALNCLAWKWATDWLHITDWTKEFSSNISGHLLNSKTVIICYNNFSYLQGSSKFWRKDPAGCSLSNVKSFCFSCLILEKILSFRFGIVWIKTSTRRRHLWALAVMLTIFHYCWKVFKFIFGSTQINLSDL